MIHAPRYREHPWHERVAGTKHYQWFARLVSLHELTQAWLGELRLERPKHGLTRGVDTRVSQSLWMLDTLASPDPALLDRLLDDTIPEDILGRLEHTVWSVQAWTLQNCVEKATGEAKRALESILEQTSWKLGRKFCESTWPALPASAQGDLRALLLALSPYTGMGGDPFLLRRAVDGEVEVELKSCPHESRYSEVIPMADLLCRLHAQWMRGFVYALNNRVALEHSVRHGDRGRRCTQRWFFA
jgi:hypothetical protein